VRGLTKWVEAARASPITSVWRSAKADATRKKAWIAWYEEFKNSLQEQREILFMGWRTSNPRRALCLRLDQKRRLQRNPRPNGGQKRLNILGALDLAERRSTRRNMKRLTADAIIAFLSYLLSCLPGIALPYHFGFKRAITNALPSRHGLNKIPHNFGTCLPPYSPNLTP